MRCRGKLRGWRGGAAQVCVTERRRESGWGGRGLTATPWGVGGEVVAGRELVSFSFILFLILFFLPPPALSRFPPYFPSITSLCASCGRSLRASTCLPAPPHALPLADTLFCTFPSGPSRQLVLFFSLPFSPPRSLSLCLSP